MMRMILAATVTVAFALMVSGCNTIAGFGKDITKGAEKVEKKIEEKTD